MKFTSTLLSFALLATLPAFGVTDVTKKYATIKISGTYAEQSNVTGKVDTFTFDNKSLATAAGIAAADVNKYALVFDTADNTVKFVAKTTVAGLPAAKSVFTLNPTGAVLLVKATPNSATVTAENTLTPATTPVSIFTTNLKGFLSSTERLVLTTLVSGTGKFAGVSKDPGNSKDVIVKFGYSVSGFIKQDID